MKIKNIKEIFSEAADPLLVREVINRNIPHNLKYSELRPIKVWPKPGNRFVFLYLAENKGKNEWLVVYLFPKDSGYDIRTCPKDAVRIVEWNGFVQFFPDDFRMPHLKIAVKPERASVFIGPVLDKAGSLWVGFNIGSVKPRGYWPGKRCQIEYGSDHSLEGNNTFFAKVYRERNGQEVLSVHESLQKAGYDGQNGLFVPRPIGYCPELRAALMEPSKGKKVCEILDEPIASDAMDSAGRLIANLHMAVLPLANPPYNLENEIKLIDGWIQVLDLIFPKESLEVKSLRDELIKRYCAAERPVRSSHRDFHDNQLLYDGSVMTILDLDTACSAPAELDVGNFLAHLSFRGIQLYKDPHKYSELEWIFLKSYRQTSEILDDCAILWFKISTLLRLACLYMIQPNGSVHFDSNIKEATKLMDRLKKAS